MSDGPEKPRPHELQSDLDLLIEMAKEPRQDAQAIHRGLESLKSKLDKFIHEKSSHADGGSSA
jgi:hypothetical protein